MTEFGDITELRADVDAADDAILQEIAWRFELTDEIGAEKLKAGLPVIDSDRKEAMIVARVAAGKALGLDARFIRNLYEVMHDESVHRQLDDKAKLTALEI